MYRYLLIFNLLLLTFCLKANAQTTLQGKVYELKTHIGLQSIRVTNLNTKQFTITDTAGLFYINASPGDLLAFRGYAYKGDTVSITNKNHLEIYMEPEGKMLNEVKVSTTDVKTGNLKAPDLNGQTVVYQRDENGNLKGGIDIRFGYGKDKKAVHNKQLTEQEIADQQIDQVFNPQNIGKEVPLKGQELNDFITMYRPDIKTFKAPNFNLTLYLNDCYKKYLALPPDKRKPVQLAKDTTFRG
jgi:hypothetical protein